MSDLELEGDAEVGGGVNENTVFEVGEVGDVGEFMGNCGKGERRFGVRKVNS